MPRPEPAYVRADAGGPSDGRRQSQAASKLPA